MANVTTITRKIQLIVMDEDVKTTYKTLYDWNEIVFRAANFAATHMYFQDKTAEFFYLTDEVKMLLSDDTVPVENIKSEKVKKEVEEGTAIRALNTSQQNSTYRVLSDKFKGQLPADIYSNLNAQLFSTFKKERVEYFSGKRSLRTYKRNMPMPFSAKSIINILPTENGNYSFTWFGLKFRTNFGRDLSGNKTIFERSLSGEYKLCNSSIQMDGKKIFLLAVFQFEANRFALDKDNTMVARLDLNTPIICKCGKKDIHIGGKEEFLYGRLAIQGALHRVQKGLRYNSGGHGRSKKIAAIERFKKSEYNYVNNKLHNYSCKLINLCLQNKCGVLAFQDQSEEMKSLEEKIKEIKSNKDLSYKEKVELIDKYTFVLSNWSYYGLKEKIAYKAKKVGVEVVQL